MVMTYEEIKSAVFNLSGSDQRRLIVEVLPKIWPQACVDDSCVEKVRGLVDEAVVNEYKKQHLDHI
jgi:hypothetical protein